MSEKVLRTSTPVAKKQHICSICGKLIEKGEKYLNVTIKQERKLVSRKTHLGCKEKSEQPNVAPSVSVSIEEQLFREQVYDDVQNRLQAFTYNENMSMVFVPFIITEFAWHFALKVVKQAADYRIDALKKLSRSVRMMRDQYLSNCRKDLSQAHIDRIHKIASMFMQNYSSDFTLLFFSMNNLLKKQWADVSYLDMRTDACIAMVMLKLLEEHNQQVDELMVKRLGNDAPPPTGKNAINDALWDCMDAYADPCQFSFDGHVRTSMQIITKKFNQIEWRSIQDL